MEGPAFLARGGGRWLRVEAAIDIRAPRDQVMEIYLDVERWGRTFAPTIRSAHILEERGGWRLIQVDHRQEGLVCNRLCVGGGEVVVEEGKAHFDGVFRNEFIEAGDGAGTRLRVTGSLRFKGAYRLLALLAPGFVRREARKRLRVYVLERMRIASEA